ncbi:MAG: acyl-CoA dehydrogenase family protein [Candidatus Hydrogenedentes bacterium]|nr:acyl-CoA dehydrogenase family protein [Candidatus Hydrogenedentota bacterium]
MAIVEDTEAIEAFREEVRAWLEENYPSELRTSGEPSEEAILLWIERLAGKGWTVPTWPTEYGGAGLSKAKARALNEEMNRKKCRLDHLYRGGGGMTMLGPTLLVYGSEEQKLEHLPRIARCEARWCQGYSEPGAGSDLAGLQMRAEDNGDYFLVNGSKIWTSGADTANWIFCLVRTDPNVKKHEGIGFLLIDMDDPGVSVEPIVLISGASQFCETRLEDVRVPKKNLVGEIDGGWTIAKDLLTFERTEIAANQSASEVPADTTDPIIVAAKHYIGETDGKLADPLIRDAVTQQLMEEQAMSIAMRHFDIELKVGAAPGAKSAMFKYLGSEVGKSRLEMHLRFGGIQYLGWEGEEFERAELELTRTWLRSRGYSIEGGTSEIQLNVVSKRVLGLPTT